MDSARAQTQVRTSRGSSASTRPPWISLRCDDDGVRVHLNVRVPCYFGTVQEITSERSYNDEDREYAVYRYYKEQTNKSRRAFISTSIKSFRQTPNQLSTDERQKRLHMMKMEKVVSDVFSSCFIIKSANVISTFFHLEDFTTKEGTSVPNPVMSDKVLPC
jgi:hypothetical protein